MKKNFGSAVALLTLATLPLWAGIKRGPDANPFELTDLIGYSGATDLTPSSITWQYTYTTGYMGSGQLLSSNSGYEMYSGLWGGSSMRSALVGNTVILSETPPARVFIPAGAMNSSFLPFKSTSPLTAPLHVSPDVIQSANRNLSAMGRGYSFPVGGMIWEIFIQDVTGQKQSGLLAKPAELTLPFYDANQDGIVDGTEGTTPVRVDTLAIWWLDETHNNWSRLPDPVINRSSNTVTANVYHFSVFAVMGSASFDPSEVYPYPVPWRPGGSGAGTGAGQTGTLAGGITFKNLPSLCVIRIYSLSGSLIKEINHTSGTSNETWDVTSDAGEPVATGIYIWVVDSNGSRRTGKLAVVR